MSARLNLVEMTLELDHLERAIAPARRQHAIYSALRPPLAPIPRSQEAPVPLPEAKPNLTPERKLLLEMADLLDQVAGLLDGTKRFQMLTRSEQHIEFLDSQARYISYTMRRLARRAEEML